jgi:hypothetical protein
MRRHRTGISVPTRVCTNGDLGRTVIPQYNMHARRLPTIEV